MYTNIQVKFLKWNFLSWNLRKAHVWNESTPHFENGYQNKNKLSSLVIKKLSKLPSVDAQLEGYVTALAPPADRTFRWLDKS